MGWGQKQRPFWLLPPRRRPRQGRGIQQKMMKVTRLTQSSLFISLFSLKDTSLIHRRKWFSPEEHQKCPFKGKTPKLLPSECSSCQFLQLWKVLILVIYKAHGPKMELPSLLLSSVVYRLYFWFCYSNLLCLQLEATCWNCLVVFIANAVAFYGSYVFTWIFFIVHDGEKFEPTSENFTW